jgi:hypothetical protein
MFHHRPSAFAANLPAIEGRLRALENELERIGRAAGRHTSAGMSATGDRVGDAIASAVTEIVDRFRSGGRLAGDEAARFGNKAAKFGNDSLHRMAKRSSTARWSLSLSPSA